MNKKNIMIVLIVVVVLAIGAFAAIGYFGNSNEQQFDSDVKSSYDLYMSITDKLNESFANNTTDLSDKGINETKQTLKDVNESNKEAINYLKDALNHTDNATEKEYINLLIKEQEYGFEAINLTNQMLDFMVQVNNGNTSSSLLTEASNIESELNKYEKQENQTLKDIKELLDKNPDLDQRIKSLGITGPYVGVNIDFN